MKLAMDLRKYSRSVEDDMKFLHKISPTRYCIDIGFVPGMKVPAVVIVNDELEHLILEELKSASGDKGGFLPALKQVANVAALPGIVESSIAMPDVHSGYVFALVLRPVVFARSELQV
jgi:tRNA-splicing ligase RtcB